MNDMTQAAADVAIDTHGLGTARKNAKVKVEPTHGGLLKVTVLGHEPMMFNPQSASVINRARAMMRGFKDVLVDCAAVSADTATGRVDAAEQYRRVKARIEHFHTGSDDWSAERAGGGGGAKDDAGLTVLAMVRAGLARDPEHAEARIVAGMAKTGESDRAAFLRKLAKDARIVKAAGEIRAERAAASNPLNADALLGAMDEEEGE